MIAAATHVAITFFRLKLCRRLCPCNLGNSSGLIHKSIPWWYWHGACYLLGRSKSLWWPYLGRAVAVGRLVEPLTGSLHGRAVPGRVVTKSGGGRPCRTGGGRQGLYHIILYYIISYYIILYYIILYYIILYCIVLYYIVLYFIMLYCIVHLYICQFTFTFMKTFSQNAVSPEGCSPGHRPPSSMWAGLPGSQNRPCHARCKTLSPYLGSKAHPTSYDVFSILKDIINTP